MTTTLKRIHDFKAGDVVLFHGHRIQLIEDARPVADNNVEDFAVTVPSTAAAKGFCLDHTTDPYFENGWVFQGNFYREMFEVQA